MLEIGDKAPQFMLLSDSGEPVSLKSFKGKTVVLYFYPKDDTPGCTQEACAFRDDYKTFAKQEAQILGVSLDPLKSHQKFKQKFRLPFPLLSDENAAVSKAYGVYKEKNMYGRKYWGIERTTFIIGPDQKIKFVFPKVKVNGHHQAVLDALRA